MRTTNCSKALTWAVARAWKGGARVGSREARKGGEFQREATKMRFFQSSVWDGLRWSGQRTPRGDGQVVVHFRAPAMAGQRSLLPALVFPLGDRYRAVMQERYSSTEVQMLDVEVTGGIVEIPLAQTGEGIADCELIRWFVQEGDHVEEFAPICEVQSDKASVVITSRYKGKVSQILWGPGDIVKVGETLLEMILEGSTPAVETKEDSNLDDKPSSTDSAAITEDIAMVNREEDKATFATPVVRHLAKNFGISLSDIVGTGKDGRIMKHDVLNYVEAKEGTKEDIQTMNAAPMQAKAEPEAKESESVSKDYAPVPSGPNSGFFNGKDTVIPIRGYRRAMAKAMTAAAAVPHFHYMEEIEVDKLVALKNSLNQSVPLEMGVKLTYLPFLIKSLSTALQKYPIMNSTVNESVSEIQIKASHNIGIAIATSFGLVVPNIKNVQQLSILEIATELSRLIQLANTNMLGSDDLIGGTITVSNFGAIGGKFGSPVLNIPEVAIVAIGRMQKVAQPSNIGRDVATVMTVTWGADHRVIDGATVARFCNEWKLLVEEPERLLLHLR